MAPDAIRTAERLRRLANRWLPRPFRNSLRLHLALLRSDRPPMLRGAPAGRILVLAPHMDDEVFGCGGTLALAAEAGAEVTVLYVTDGRKGYHPGRFSEETPEQRMRRETRLVEIRKTEAREATRVLGFEPPRFLDLPDGRLAITRDAVAKVAEAVRAVRPEVVFLPFLTDLHRDHWITNGLMIEAATQIGLDDDLDCWGYEVWTPLVANAVVDISRVAALKGAAMRVFESQLQDVNYSRVMQGLNTYRSLCVDEGRGDAEAFYVTRLCTYRGLYRAADHEEKG